MGSNTDFDVALLSSTIVNEQLFHGALIDLLQLDLPLETVRFKEGTTLLRINPHNLFFTFCAQDWVGIDTLDALAILSLVQDLVNELHLPLVLREPIEDRLFPWRFAHFIN